MYSNSLATNGASRGDLKAGPYHNPKSVLHAAGELSGGTISVGGQDMGLAVPAIRASIGVDPGENERHAIYYETALCKTKQKTKLKNQEVGLESAVVAGEVENFLLVALVLFER